MGRITGPYAKAKATHLLHSHWRPDTVAKDLPYQYYLYVGATAIDISAN